MKYVKLFEAFTTSGSGMGKVYATCFQGDAFAGVGIIDESQQEELQNAVNKALSEYPDLGEYLRIDKVDVTGMGYILHTPNGEFKAMPTSTNTEDYLYYIMEDGDYGNRSIHEFPDSDSRLFSLVEGQMLSIDHHGHTKLSSVAEFIRKNIGLY